jgi:hypothetical protein
VRIVGLTQRADAPGVRSVFLVLATVAAVASATAALAAGMQESVDCSKTSVGLTPLTELGTGTYKVLSRRAVSGREEHHPRERALSG